MANLELDDALIPEFTNATSADLIPAHQGGSAGKLTATKILALLVAGASSGFDNLLKLETATLHKDGSNSMTGDLDMNTNRITNLEFPGILVQNPTVITTSDSTWDFNVLTKNAWVFLCGAGGAGGGADSSSAANAAAGDGGAGGAWLFAVVDVTALTNKWANITIGAGGTGSAGATGGSGGTSTWSDDINTFTANGGAGGSGVASGSGNISLNADTASPTSSGGLINVNGEPGTGYILQGATIDPSLNAKSGKGGNSPWGSGGPGVRDRSSSAAQTAGIAGGGNGSGGGGATSIAAGTSVAGGNGTNGICIVIEFM